MDLPKTDSISDQATPDHNNTRREQDVKSVKQPIKRKKFTKNLSAGRHGGVSHAKLPKVSSLQIQPKHLTFPIFTSNLGCIELASSCFRTIESKDYRLAQNISVLQLQYVLTIAFCNRIAQCAIHHGYAFPLNANRLKQHAASIQLPDILAHYIESIGRITLPSGLSIAPWISDYPDFFRFFGMTDPALIINQANREPVVGDWSIDVDWIISYNDATTRAARSGMNFRIVDNTTFQGRLELAVSYRTEGDLLKPVAPMIISESECHLGALYRFRNYAEIAEWPGIHKELLFDGTSTVPCNPMQVFSDLCVASFRGNTFN